MLESLDLRRIILIAHSGASGDAIRYITRHGPDRIARVVPVGATGPRMLAGPGQIDGVPPAMLETVLTQLATDLSGWIDANIAPFAPGASNRVNDWMAAMVLDCSRRAVVDFQRTIAEADLTAETAALGLSVTIIHGDKDVSAPIALTGQRSAALIPGAELLVYEGAAHGIMVTEPSRLATISRRRSPMTASGDSGRVMTNCRLI